MTTQPTSCVARSLGIGISVLFATMTVTGLCWHGSPVQQERPPEIVYEPRLPIDLSGYSIINDQTTPWVTGAQRQSRAGEWQQVSVRVLPLIEAVLADPETAPDRRVAALLAKASLFNYAGHTQRAAEVLQEARTTANKSEVAAKWLYTIIYVQGITALRQGEAENGGMGRGECLGVLPLSPAARQINAASSQLAVRYFTEYLDRFPDDLEVQWLLNIAHMRLGLYPNQVDPRFRISLDRYTTAEHSIGQFREIGERVGINGLNMAGGVIMDDFDNDGLLDLLFTSMAPTSPLLLCRNRGDGTFEDQSLKAGIFDRIGGLGCVQGDYNNDGFLDLYIPPGAQSKSPRRPGLLRNNGNGTFTDVTSEVGLCFPMNSDSAQWADFDNDGWLDLFVCGEAGPSRLYRNLGGDSFEEVAARAGLGDLPGMCKGC